MLRLLIWIVLVFDVPAFTAHTQHVRLDVLERAELGLPIVFVSISVLESPSQDGGLFIGKGVRVVCCGEGGGECVARLRGECIGQSPSEKLVVLLRQCLILKYPEIVSGTASGLEGEWNATNQLIPVHFEHADRVIMPVRLPRREQQFAAPVDDSFCMRKAVRRSRWDPASKFSMALVCLRGWRDIAPRALIVLELGLLENGVGEERGGIG